MNVLLLGGGGREHALGWKLANSPDCDKLCIAPGNAGTAEIGTNANIQEDDFGSIKRLVLEQKINLVVVGPEKPLVEGIVDYFLNDPDIKDVPVLGPDKTAAQLEGSKAYAKAFMKQYNVPTGEFAAFQSSEVDKAKDAINNQQPPYVIKADGLAAGKGVVICDNEEEAKQTLEDYLVKEKLGGAGKNIVLEEYLPGEELSIIIMTDGEDYVMLPSARDYKRAGEGDTGPNTGGMGAISPLPGISQSLTNRIRETIIEPTIKGIKQENNRFRGFLYFGLVLVDDEPYVLEYNVRLGDPEAEAILPRLDADLLSVARQTINQDLSQVNLPIKSEVAASVMMVSGGYPGDYEKGKIIKGLDQLKDSWVFHAGTKVSDGGDILTSGGRVLAVTSLGNHLSSALEKCYASLENIHFDNSYYRKDIGQSF